MQCKDTVGDFQAVVAPGKCGCHVVLLLNDAVELSEGGESSCAHPHDEILIYEAVVVWVKVQLINRLVPVDRLRCVWKMRSVLVKRYRKNLYPIVHIQVYSTYKNSSKIWVASTRVPELHMFVRPPCNPFFDEWNLCFCSIGINVKQIQCV